MPPPSFPSKIAGIPVDTRGFLPLLHATLAASDPERVTAFYSTWSRLEAAGAQVTTPVHDSLGTLTSIEIAEDFLAHFVVFFGKEALEWNPLTSRWQSKLYSS